MVYFFSSLASVLEILYFSFYRHFPYFSSSSFFFFSLLSWILSFFLSLWISFTCLYMLKDNKILLENCLRLLTFLFFYFHKELLDLIFSISESRYIVVELFSTPLSSELFILLKTDLTFCLILYTKSGVITPPSTSLTPFPPISSDILLILSLVSFNPCWRTFISFSNFFLILKTFYRYLYLKIYR